MECAFNMPWIYSKCSINATISDWATKARIAVVWFSCLTFLLHLPKHQYFSFPDYVSCVFRLPCLCP